MRDILRVLGANVAGRGAGVLALVIYARVLTPVELAAQPVFLLLSAFVNVPFHGGTFTTLLREMPAALKRDRHDADSLLRAVVLWTLGGIVAVVAVYAIVATTIASVFLEDAAAASLVRLMLMGCVLKGLDELLTFALRATASFHALARKKLISELSQPLIALSLIPLFRERGLILGQTIGLGLAVAWSIWSLRTHLFAPVRPQPLGPLLRRSRPYYVEGGVFYAAQMGDQAIFGALTSPSVLSAYFVARRLLDALSNALYAFEEVMTSKLAQARGVQADEDRARHLLVFSVLAFVVPSGAIGTGLAPTIARALGGDQYAAAGMATGLLSLSLIPLGVMTIVWPLALALGSPGDRLKVSSVFAVLLMLVTLATAPFGLIPVAGGRLLATVVAAFVAVRMTRHLPFQVASRDVAVIVGGALVAVLPPFIAQETHLSTSIVLALAAASSIACGAGLLLHARRAGFTLAK